ncbi:hypothetical protein J2S19_001247 [Metabacillus malikii]|uniref:Uncharacterized protein n=1 Tax=Metabacillus malikii TaxID=1504265 RepID=A0ABT9ZDA5_9BACI|nr:hypothetical protein [Metabacillus malikii]
MKFPPAKIMERAASESNESELASIDYSIAPNSFYLIGNTLMNE